MIALGLAVALGADVKLSDTSLTVDGLVVLDAAKTRLGNGHVVWTLSRQGQTVLDLERVKGLEGKSYFTVTLHPELDRFQGDFQADEEGLLDGFVRAGVLKWGAFDRDAFGAYADARGLPLENLSDRDRQAAVAVANRCPLVAMVQVTSARGTGRTVTWDRSQAPKSESRMDVLRGDRVCLAGLGTRPIPGDRSCVDVGPSTDAIEVDVDCKRVHAR